MMMMMMVVVEVNGDENDDENNNNETGSRSPCMRPRSDPPNFGPITKRIGW